MCCTEVYLRFNAWLLTFLLAFSSHAFADAGDFFLDPYAGVGFNSAQGTAVRIGADLGMYIDDFLAVGIGGFYGAGSNPEHDREAGVGPFVTYNYPLFDFLTANL